MSTLSDLQKQLQRQDAQLDALTAFVQERRLRLDPTQLEELAEAFATIAQPDSSATASVPTPTGIRA